MVHPPLSCVALVFLAERAASPLATLFLTLYNLFIKFCQGYAFSYSGQTLRLTYKPIYIASWLALPTIYCVSPNLFYRPRLCPYGNPLHYHLAKALPFFQTIGKRCRESLDSRCTAFRINIDPITGCKHTGLHTWESPPSVAATALRSDATPLLVAHVSYGTQQCVLGLA
jgi:hypothetical protein